ncbi:diiron oxygenase [Hydrogenophaga sp.]|uniref:diiron oxygenase n=1 Tax=Hydrogenophaga sp. TaxID=1904254 RepID=UPI00262DDCB7|nr:diiron oxygenase [Hydrogenophaga sp.]MCW5654379.1 diiron oxygenase [Hydrogenophaga sp.]
MPSLTDFVLDARGDELSGVRWLAFGAADELLSHPALGDLDLQTRNRLGAARLVHFLDDMALTEHRIVNVAAQRIAENRLRGHDVPEPLALDALKLYTDEGYHAYFTALAVGRIREAFGLAAYEGPSQKITGIEALVAEVPAPRRDMAWFLVGFVGETMVTKAIVDAMRSTAHSALQRLLLAHLEDEWVHARYFAHLFSRVWPTLAAQERADLGELLPRIMGAFHVRDPERIAHTLTDAGVPASARKTVLARQAPEEGQFARARHMGANTLQVMARCGVFRDEAVRGAFVRAGLIDRDGNLQGKSA